jgi:outer membrane receptor protein involved in Fe transport
MHKLLSFLFLFTLVTTALFGQKIEITGAVRDASSGEPVPYATVALHSQITDGLITGTTTKANGSFAVRTDSSEIYLQITFIGYEEKRVNSISISDGKANLGVIDLEPIATGLEEVEVVAEKSEMEFRLDKRVFNVGKDLSSTGMGALDVLENVPSVNVDIEGQVSLRGNTGVQILINGKPSILADQEGNALGSITADMIESVEVITNPSAKYEAEGTSGIINIILKKEEKKGLNGSISANTGIPANHSLGGSMNYRTDNFNFFTQFGAGYRSIPTFRESINRNLLNNTELRSDGTEFRNEAFYNITLGTDYYLTDRDIITLSANYAFEDEEQPSDTEFEFYGENGVLDSKWKREESTTAENPKYQFDLQYKKEFRNNEDHTLLFSSQGSFFGKEQRSDFTNTPIINTDVDPDQKTRTDFFEREFTFQLDYTNPITEEITIETGALYQINDVGNDYAVLNEENGVFVIDSSLTNNFEWNQKVLGVYATAAYEKEKWGIKAGLRVENTDLRTLLTNTNEENNQYYTNFFPSFHTSYKINELFSLQAGYSRRIFRPRLWDLNPFFNIRNNYNVRRGNPDLLPEYADSYELTGIFIFEKISLNSSIYYLYTQDVVERVSFLENGEINVTMPMNIGTRDQIGFEVNGKYKAMKWLTFNWDFNYGYFDRKGDFEDQSFDFNGDQWSAELTSKFKLPSDFEFEVSGNYQSSVVTVQGERSGFAFMDVGARKKFLKGKIVVNLSVRDVFASRIRENFVYNPDFFFYDFSQRGRFFTLGVSYGFGKGEAMTYSGRRR